MKYKRPNDTSWPEKLTPLSPHTVMVPLASFPCFDINTSTYNLMTTNNQWFTIFFDFKVMFTY